ncbi:heparinase II/III domain-containing protein [Luteimonas lutimaris]|uniref:Heparinase II/III-like C-terminal domain-containing protein n=1 Tax=Luteimonas lutimaris TaxID=698645 RepID=A0ABP7MWK2_9GAMM
MYEKLRQPDFDRYRKPEALSLFLSAGEIDICRPFAPWQLPEEPTWREDPHGDDTWGLYYHALGWMIILDHGIDNAPNAETRSACSGRLEHLLFSYLRHVVETPEEEVHRMLWFDHATAWRASAIAYLYQRRFKDKASPDETALFRAAARRHEEKLREFIESGRWNANNHGIFHAEALWDLVQVFEGPDDGLAEIALGHMRNVFSNMIDFEEGVCREQSIYYHLFDASLLADSARYMEGFGVEVVPGYKEILARMLDFFHAFCPQGEFLQSIGDTQFGKKPDSRLLQNISSAAPHWELAGGEHPSDPTLRTFPRNGYYFFREEANGNSPSSFAILIDKPYHGAHGHADGGSFMLNRGGEPFLVDSGGPYAYGKRLRFNYFKAAEAHNVAILDEKSQNYLTRVTAISQAKLGNSVRLETVDLEGTTWQRTAVSLRGGTFVLIDRFLKGPADIVDVLFHLSPTIDVTQLSDSTRRLKGEESFIDVWQASNAKLKTTLNSGEEGFPRGLLTRDLAKVEPGPVLSTRLRANDTWLVTVLGNAASPPLVQTLYGGKLVRVMTYAEQAMAVDCSLDNHSLPPRIYSFRTH